MRGRPHSLEWWIGVVRLSAVPFAVLQVSLTTDLSTTDERTAWALVAALAVGAVVLFATVGDGTSRLHTAISMVFDFSILGAFVILYAFEQGTPTRQLLLIGVVAGAIRYGMVGGIVTALAYVPVAIWFEAAARGPVRRRVPHRLRHLSGRRRPDHGQPRRLARQSHPRSSGRTSSAAPRRPRSCATSSAAAPTSSTPPIAVRERSTRRSISTRRRRSSSASCAGSCPSTAWRSCSPRRASRT